MISTLTVALALSAALLTLPAAAGAKPKPLYVSLGDSYATGFQVTPEGGRNTRNGFAYQIPGLAKQRGYDLKLVNFGCGGETSTSLLMRVSVCRGPGPGGRDYAGTTQIHAAESFLRKHRDRVKLITVSIGGNDVTACAPRGRPDRLRRHGCADDREERDRDREAAPQGRRREGPDRRHHLPRRDPRPVGGGGRGPGPREALRGRLQAADQPDADQGLRGRPAAASWT